MTMKRFKNEKFNNKPAIGRVFKAEAINADTHKLTIYGDIGESAWGEYVTTSDVENALKGIEAKNIDVHISSYGGDAFTGIAIYNLLKDHPATITTHVEGIAASAASLIAMAGDKVVMNVGSMLMIHEASTIVWGNKGDIQKTYNALEKIDESIGTIYMTKFQGERGDIDKMITNETWFTAKEAVEAGLADSINEEKTPPADPEEVKNAILDKIRNRKPEPPQDPAPSILNRFKR
ncbi:Clp protease ClpP [Rossellomorea marisflavi]|uniref:head maturation protease, ClpP-related n=1 Tax=Rossellomorea marisflavi TaxID=189381 RepID=UPI003458D5EB